MSQMDIQSRRKELAIEWMNIAGDCSERSVEIVSEDAVFESDAFPFLKTPQEYGKMMSQIVNVLPDFEMEFPIVTSDGEHVTILERGSGTHTGEPFGGPDGLPATGKKQTWRCVWLFRIEDKAGTLRITHVVKGFDFANVCRASGWPMPDDAMMAGMAEAGLQARHTHRWTLDTCAQTMTSFLCCGWIEGILPSKALPKSMSQTDIQSRRKELAIEWMNIAGDCSERSVKIVSEDAVFESDAFPFLKTPQEYGKMMSQIVNVLPDFDMEFPIVTSDGEYVTILERGSGTHTGEPFGGPDGLPATGKKQTWRCVWLFRIEDKAGTLRITHVVKGFDFANVCRASGWPMPDDAMMASMATAGTA